MDVMFWVWLGVIVVTAIIEFATMEVVSIWFTFGAIIPFILAATNAVRWEYQLIIFVALSAVLIASLRRVTKKYLLKNSDGKTNIDLLIGQKCRMLKRTDFETVGSIKINDVVWSAIGENQQKIEENEIVEIVQIAGNKLIVKKVSENLIKSENIEPKMTETENEEKVEKTSKKSEIVSKKKVAPKQVAENKNANVTTSKMAKQEAGKNIEKKDERSKSETKIQSKVSATKTKATTAVKKVSKADANKKNNKKGDK